MNINRAILGLIPALTLAAASAHAAVIVHIDNPADAVRQYFTTTESNTIEAIGKTGPRARAGIFDGTATFAATLLPESATSTTFLVGFGFLGLAFRRKVLASLRIA